MFPPMCLLSLFQNHQNRDRHRHQNRELLQPEQPPPEELEEPPPEEAPPEEAPPEEAPLPALRLEEETCCHAASDSVSESPAAL